MIGGAIPIVSDLFQYLLDGLGWVLARIYDVVPNYGLAIIVLTILIRFVLFPLGIKQIKSMQHMQAMQPKIKEIQKKYKNNKQKVQEETMRLYKEAGVNPLGSCLPVLAQFPILISMYAVLRAPGYEPVSSEGQVTAYRITNNHIPVDSDLFASVVTHENTDLLVVNLQCSADQAGNLEKSMIKDSEGNAIEAGLPLENDNGSRLDSFTSKPFLDCGVGGLIDKIPYIVLLALMIGTTFFQQRQMQKSSPPGAASQQQQMILKIMPLFFGFIGYTFPTGLVLYWTTSNFFQIGQQTLLLRAGHIGPDAVEKRMAEQRQKQAKQAEKGTTQRKGFMASMLDRAEQERKRRDASGGTKPGTSSRGGGKGNAPRGDSSKGGSSKGGTPRGGTAKGKGGGGGTRGVGGPKGSSSSKGAPRRPKKPGSEGSGGTRG